MEERGERERERRERERERERGSVQMNVEIADCRRTQVVFLFVFM